MIWTAWGAMFMLVGVAAGAFGAHGLKNRLAPDLLAIFETAVRYQIYHALGLFAVAWLARAVPSGLVSAAGACMVAGTLIFSGSLYILVFTNVRAWGAVTPIGGTLFIAAWALVLRAAIKAA